MSKAPRKPAPRKRARAAASAAPAAVPPRASDGSCAVCGAAASVVRRLDRSLCAQGRDLLAEYRTLLARAKDARPAGASRWQDDLIERELQPGASILDLGCGNGDLLVRLTRMKKVRGQGIELDAPSVIRCVEQGVAVFQADLDEGLKGFPDRSFDVVVLEETLQTLHRPLKVLDEMLRVGRLGIVSFPNFGYWRVRLSLTLEGRMPVTERLPYRWHDTPNIHLLTLQDFLDWAAGAGVRVVKAFALAGGCARPMEADDNLNAEEALFFLARK